MIQFEIEIKNDRRKTYRIFNWFGLVISLAGFSLLLLYDKWFWEASIALGIVLGYLLYRMYLLRKRKIPSLFDDEGYFFLFLALGWAVLYKFFLVLICLLLGLAYKLAMQKIFFLFRRDKILKTNFPKREIEWTTLDNVILKDGILTLDFKNNHVIQGEILSAEKIDEKEFNAFARFLIINEQL